MNKIVTICGSFKYKDMMLKKSLELELEDKYVVLQPVYGIDNYSWLITFTRNNGDIFDFDKDVNYMSERTGSYPVVEKDFGTKFFNKEVLCGIRYINEFKPFINHLILDDYMIDEDVFVKILSIFKEGLDASGDELIGLEREVNSLVSCDLGFFDKKTIYVVKRK